MPFADLARSRIRYRLRKGEGLPLLLVHGAAGGQYVWQEQFEGLAPGRTLLAPDLPGHGQSKPGLDEVSIEGYAEVVLAFAEAMGLQRYVLVGHSMGGAIAQTMARQHPEVLAGLVLVGTGARLPISDIVLDAVKEHYHRWGPLMAMTAYAPTTSRELVKRYCLAPPQTSAAVALADFQACQLFDFRAELTHLELPALVVAGDADQLVGGGRVQQLAAGLPQAELVQIPEAGHMVMQEQPAAFAAAVEAFLEAL